MCFILSSVHWRAWSSMMTIMSTTLYICSKGNNVPSEPEVEFQPSSLFFLWLFDAELLAQIPWQKAAQICFCSQNVLFLRTVFLSKIVLSVLCKPPFRKLFVQCSGPSEVQYTSKRKSSTPTVRIAIRKIWKVDIPCNMVQRAVRFRQERPLLPEMMNVIFWKPSL